jgi:energy-dependent translational throttle protein EttA
MKMAEPLDDDEMAKVYDEQGEVQDAIDAAERLGPRPHARDRDGRPALSARRRRRHDALRRRARRVALCRLLLSKPDLLLLDEPTNHLDAESVAWLERHLEEYPGTVVAVTHDRYFLDNVAGGSSSSTAARAYPFEGNYSGWLEQKQERLREQEEQESARQKTLAASSSGSSLRRRARQAKSKARIAPTRSCSTRSAPRAGHRRDRDPQRPAPRRRGRRGRGPEQGLRRQAAHRGPDLQAAARRHRRRHRPNGAGKTTLFRMIVGDEKPDDGSSASARP